MLPSPTDEALGATGGLAQPPSNDQGESSKVMETQADPVSPLVPRTRRVKLGRQLLIRPRHQESPQEERARLQGERVEQLQQTQQGTDVTRMTQTQEVEMIVTASQAQPTENVQPMKIENASQDAQPSQIETAVPTVDKDMQDDTATVMTVTEFSLEVEARRGLITQRLAQLPNAISAPSYMTEHTYKTAQSQFVRPKQQDFVTLYTPNRPKLEGDWNQAPMGLKMKLWTQQ